MSFAHVETDKMRCFALDQLSTGDGSAVETHLMECASCRNTLAALASDGNWPGKERRRDPRVQSSGTVRLRVLDPIPSDGPRTSVQLVDGSKWGIRVDSPRAIKTGAVIQLRVHQQTVFGEVMWCNPAGDGFHIGLQLLDVF